MEKPFAKPKSNHRLYIKILRGMTPEKGLLKAFELTEFSKELFLSGLRKRFKGLPEEKIKKIYLKRLDKCHNRNY